MDQDDFYAAIKEGHEIEICFRGKWFFFGKCEKNRMIAYLFYEMCESQPNEILTFGCVQELLSMKVQNVSLIDVLCNLDDYTVYQKTITVYVRCFIDPFKYGHSEIMFGDNKNKGNKTYTFGRYREVYEDTNGLTGEGVLIVTSNNKFSYTVNFCT